MALGCTLLLGYLYVSFPLVHEDVMTYNQITAAAVIDASHPRLPTTRPTPCRTVRPASGPWPLQRFMHNSTPMQTACMQATTMADFPACAHDALALDALLTPEERAVRIKVRDFAVSCCD